MVRYLVLVLKSILPDLIAILFVIRLVLTDFDMPPQALANEDVYSLFTSGFWFLITLILLAWGWYALGSGF